MAGGPAHWAAVAPLGVHAGEDEMIRQGMAIGVAVLLGGSLAGPAAATRAGGDESPKSTCIFLVKKVKDAGDIYVGEFAILRKTGSKVKGGFGAFYSEGMSFRGRIVDGKLKGNLYDDYGGTRTNITPVHFTWVASEQRIKGWRRVSRKQMLVYSGGYVPAKGTVCSGS